MPKTTVLILALVSAYAVVAVSATSGYSQTSSHQQNERTCRSIKPRITNVSTRNVTRTRNAGFVSRLFLLVPLRFFGERKGSASMFIFNCTVSGHLIETELLFKGTGKSRAQKSNGRYDIEVDNYLIRMSIELLDKDKSTIQNYLLGELCRVKLDLAPYALNRERKEMQIVEVSKCVANITSELKKIKATPI